MTLSFRHVCGSRLARDADGVVIFSLSRSGEVDSRTAQSGPGLVFIGQAITLIVGLVSFASGCNTPGTNQNVDGVRHFQQGQPQAAIQDFQQALAQNPANADCYYNLGASYHYMGKHRGDAAMMSQSESLYHQCLDLQPDHLACHRALAVLLVDTNRPKSAFVLLERWSARSPQLAEPRIELARLHEEFGQNTEAQRYLAEAIDINPSDPRAWTAMANLRESQGEYAQALQNYQQAYYLNNYQPGVANRIASLQQKMALAPTPSPGGARYAEAPNGWTTAR